MIDCGGADMPPDAIYYISGPMSGIPEFNYPFFKKIAEHLRNRNFTVLSPGDVDGGAPPETYTPEASYKWYLYQSLDLLRDAERIIMLPGWWNSKGARIEHDIAQAANMPVYYLTKFAHWQDDHDLYVIVSC